VVEFAPL